MPRSDAAALPTVGQAWTALCGAHRGLVLGARRLAETDAQIAAELGAVGAGTRVLALCWTLPTQPPISAVRILLAPGAVFAVLAAPPRSALARALPWPARKEPQIEALCTALLLQGFVEPTSTPCAESALLVHATLPARVHELDVFFEQPTPAASR